MTAATPVVCTFIAMVGGHVVITGTIGVCTPEKRNDRLCAPKTTERGHNLQACSAPRLVVL